MVRDAVQSETSVSGCEAEGAVPIHVVAEGILNSWVNRMDVLNTQTSRRQSCRISTSSWRGARTRSASV
jgi:hypothetical protein